ncbi:arylesterase [Aquabacterium sp. CECT 9606]|uniref:arylesterase n=1 Tax=Aquabacterium sp. CECT 9606 TaxID=2845822 RepID=UPI001E40013B|nr:arylesterase [Aquabacterium sp. CECT 9606]CAH0352927.1 Esterase TesA [Aquabacterium sp. CECT 9606]
MPIDFTRRVRMALAGLVFSLLTSVGNAATTVATTSTVLVMGDSLSAEYGLARGTGWVALLEKRLQAEKINAQVVNASISGETTAGGVTRLPALLAQHHPNVVVIELGANDALRGFALSGTQSNLTTMVKASKAVGAKVVMVGMQVPPNFGKRYTEDFAGLFPKLAKSESVALVPFFLKGVADRADARDWFQADGMHPNAKAHPVILENMWPALKPLLLGCQR